MDIELDEGRVTNAAEAVDLPGLDDKNVTCTGFEFLSIDGPETATFPHELDFIIRMAMGPGTVPREGAEEEHGDIHVAVIGPDKAMRAALKWQVLLTDTVHSAYPPLASAARFVHCHSPSVTAVGNRWPNARAATTIWPRWCAS
jgi:hypothetical protein